MTTKKLEELLQQGEGIEVEFKTAAFDLNKDTFDSICAFEQNGRASTFGSKG
jgi:predicted HTH transcriptional regulator